MFIYTTTQFIRASFACLDHFRAVATKLHMSHCKDASIFLGGGRLLNTFSADENVWYTMRVLNPVILYCFSVIGVGLNGSTHLGYMRKLP